ncbi:hypothetical protein D3C80_2213910 [compost metagenome]
MHPGAGDVARRTHEGVGQLPVIRPAQPEGIQIRKNFAGMVVCCHGIDHRDAGMGRQLPQLIQL